MNILNYFFTELDCKYCTERLVKNCRSYAETSTYLFRNQVKILRREKPGRNVNCSGETERNGDKNRNNHDGESRKAEIPMPSNKFASDTE